MSRVGGGYTLKYLNSAPAVTACTYKMRVQVYIVTGVKKGTKFSQVLQTFSFRDNKLTTKNLRE
jgi:hypothetical protein